MPREDFAATIVETPVDLKLIQKDMDRDSLEWKRLQFLFLLRTKTCITMADAGRVLKYKGNSGVKEWMHAYRIYGTTALLDQWYNIIAAYERNHNPNKAPPPLPRLHEIDSEIDDEEEVLTTPLSRKEIIGQVEQSIDQIASAIIVFVGELKRLRDMVNSL